MKKIIFIAAFVLFAQLLSGQILQKGNLLGLHIMTVSLKPNVTMDQFTTFFIDKVIPEYEKQFDVKGYIVKGIRGEVKNSFGIIWLFKTDKARNKYFKEDGFATEEGLEAMLKVAPIGEELKKLGTYSTKYTDWVVQ